MNRIYNLVFNRALGQLQVVSEFAHRRRDGAGGPQARRVVVMLSALALGIAGLPAVAQVASTQLPAGGTVLGGIGSITTDGTGSMTITQIDPRAVIVWDNFDVGVDASVIFEQGIGDIALNQIMDADPSQIFGTIEAPGTIFLLNQNGIVFGETAQINVGGLVASTLSIDASDFLQQQGGEYVNNSFVFEQTGSPASIINYGDIVVTNGGHAVLLGGHVLNDTSGLISAEAGRVDLLGGKSATLNLFPGSDFSIVVGDALDATVTGALAVVENWGRLEANGGAVYLHARLAAGVLGDAVNHSGTIDATGLGAQADGSVTLVGSGSAVRSTGDIESGAVSMSGTGGLFLGGNVSTSGGQGYDDTVVLVGDTTLSSSGGDIQFGSTVDGAHALAVSAAGTVGFGGTVGQTNALDSLSVAAADFLAPALVVMGDLSVTASGGIGQSGAFLVGGTATFNAGNAAITLNDVNNDFAGPVHLDGGTILIRDANALTLGTVTADQLMATSTGALNLGTTDVTGSLVARSNGGAIGQGGALSVGGTTELDAGTGDITLTDAGNNFAGAVDVTGGAIALRDMNDLTIASLSNGANQAVTLVAGGALNLGGGAIDTGTADLALQSGALLTTTSDLGGANVTLRGDDGIYLGADVTATGDLSLTSQDAAIVQTGGVLTVDGDTDVDAGTGDVTLASAGNDFVGAVDITGNTVSITDANALILGTVTAGQLTATSTGALDLGTTDVTGSLVARSNGGAIGQGGALSVGGTTELDAGTGDITLTDAGNNFAGAVDVTGGAIALRDMNDLTIASLSNGANQAVTLVAGGALNLGGGAIDTGTADLALQSGALLTTAVDLGGANVTLRGDDGISLGADVTATGNLSLTSQDAAIVQTGGVLRVDGDTDVGAGTGDVTLASAGNDFGGAVDIIGDAVVIRDDNALALGTVTAGQLTATSTGALDLGTTDVTGSLVARSNNGAIGQGGALSVGGTTELDAGTGNITLTDAGNDFVGAVDITGNTVSITDANALILGTVTAGQLTATSTGALGLGTTDVTGSLVARSNDGAIGQGGALSVGGTTELDAGTGDITLTDAGNNFAGAVDVTGGAIALRDMNDLTIASLSNGANQAVTLVAGGALNLGGGAIDTGTADLALQSGTLLTTAVDLGGANVTLRGNDGIALGADVTATGNLSLTSQDAAIVQTGGVLTVDGDTDVDAGTGDVTLASAGNDFGGAVDIIGDAVVIRDANALTLGTVTAGQLTATSTGALDLGTTDVTGSLVAHSNGGAIGQGGALFVGGTTELDAGTGNVMLTDAGNDFVGAVDITGNAVSITDANALILGAVTAGQLTATSTGALDLGTTDVTGSLVARSNNGAIGQGGALSVGGTTELDAGTGNITLTDAGNDFVGAVDITGNTVSITDANALILGAVTAGQLTATSTGALDLGTTDITGSLVARSNGGAIGQGGALFVGGTTELDAGTGDITLTDAGNNFAGAVDVTGGAIALRDMNDLTVASLSNGANQAVTLVAGGALNLGGGAIDTGTADLALQSGALLTTTSGLGGANVTLRGDDGIALGADVTATGNLSLTSQDAAIVQTGGVLTVDGDTDVDAGTGDVTLASAGNDFIGAVDITGNTVAITDANALILGTVTAGQLMATSKGRLDLGATDVSGALVAHSNGGAIEQSGALSVDGTTELDAGTGNITLTDAGNDFVGAVDITGNTVSITDVNALTLGTVAAGQLTVTSTGRLDLGTTDVTGALVAHSNGGAIEQGGALFVGGATELDAGTGDVTLTDAGNNFVGAVDVTGGAIALRDKNDLTVASLANGADQAVTLVAGGALNLGGSSIDTGTADLSLQSGALLTTTAVLDGANVSLRGDGGIVLGADVTATGDLSLASRDAAIAQTGGVLAVGGSTDVDAGTGDVTLANVGNDFGGTVDITGGIVAITDANALVLGTVTAGQLTATSTGRLDLGATDVSGALVAHSNGGAIEQGGALRVGGTTELDAGTGDVALSNAGNDFVGTVDVTGGAISLRDMNDLTIVSLANGVDQAVTLVAGDALSLGGNAIDTGTADLMLQSGALLTTTAGLGGANVILRGDGGIVLGADVMATGDLSLTSRDAAIEQTGGVVSVGGRTDVDAGTGDITLADAGNDFVGVVSITGDAIEITDANALTLGTVSAGQLTATSTGRLDLGTTDVSGTLVARSNGGTIEQGGALHVGGTAELDAGMGDVTLTNVGNDFAGVVDITGAAVAITDANALTLGTVTADQLVATSTGRLDLGSTDVSGALAATSNGGGIVQGGALRVGGTTVLDAGTGDVTLTNADNDFVGAVDVSGGAISLQDVNDLTIATLENGVNQAVALTAGGALGLGVASVDTGTADLSLQSGARLAVTADLNGANVTLRGDDGIALAGRVTAIGDLSLASRGASIVQDGGAISVGGNTNVDAGTGDVSLANADNDFVGVVNIVGDAVEVADANALTLGAITAGQLKATSGNALTLAGPVDGGRHALLTAIDGDILIDGRVAAQKVHLDAGGAITAREGGSIIAGVLSGRAGGPTTLGAADHYVDNQVDVLGNFISRSGFSMTNGRTLTLASVDGSGFTVDAGTADTYLSVVGGDLLQEGTTWLYNGNGTFASTGHIGLSYAPIYVLGTGPQYVAEIGKPPAYFYAVSTDGTLLPILGGPGLNTLIPRWAARIQNASYRTIASLDVGAGAPYNGYSIIEPGIRLPDGQHPACDAGSPERDCSNVQ